MKTLILLSLCAVLSSCAGVNARGEPTRGGLTVAQWGNAAGFAADVVFSTKPPAPVTSGK